MTAAPPLSLPTACSAADQKEMIGMPNADPPSKFGINEKSVFSTITQSRFELVVLDSEMGHPNKSAPHLTVFLNLCSSRSNVRLQVEGP